MYSIVLLYFNCCSSVTCVFFFFFLIVENICRRLSGSKVWLIMRRNKRKRYRRFILKNIKISISLLNNSLIVSGAFPALIIHSFFVVVFCWTFHHLILQIYLQIYIDFVRWDICFFLDFVVNYDSASFIYHYIVYFEKIKKQMSIFSTVSKWIYSIFIFSYFRMDRGISMSLSPLLTSTLLLQWMNIEVYVFNVFMVIMLWTSFASIIYQCVLKV